MRYRIAAILVIATLQCFVQPSGEEKWGVVLAHPEMKNVTVKTDVACGYAHIGAGDKAIAALEQAIEKGFSSRQQAESNADLQLLKSEARFKTLLQKLK